MDDGTEGPVSSVELLSRLRAIVAHNEPCLEAARSDRIAREVAQSLRREQDEAYMESLRADQEKERKKTEEIEKRKRAEEKKREEMLEEQLRKEEIRKQKIDLLNEIPNEPDKSDPNSMSVVFKLPSGERLERRFLQTDTLRDIYNFVFCHPSSPDFFELTTNFPKRILDCQVDSRKTLKQVGLGQREVVFVYDLEA